LDRFLKGKTTMDRRGIAAPAAVGVCGPAATGTSPDSVGEFRSGIAHQAAIPMAITPTEPAAIMARTRVRRGRAGASSAATANGIVATAAALIAQQRTGPAMFLTLCSPNPDQDYFADSITEDLTTDLSRISGSFVIAPTTAFTYKGKGLGAKQIGRELGVRYVLDGSVRRTGDHVQVNVQLIDAESGAQLWTDRLASDRTDLVKAQKEITSRIAIAEPPIDRSSRPSCRAGRAREAPRTGFLDARVGLVLPACVDRNSPRGPAGLRTRARD
jgi:TolB-like protein